MSLINFAHKSFRSILSAKSYYYNSAFVSLFALTAFTPAANANSAPAAWYLGMTITNLDAENPFAGNGQATVTKISSSSTPGQGSGYSSVQFGTCGGTAFTLDPTQPNYKVILSMILMAYASNTPINIFTVGNCANSGISLDAVSLSR